MQVRKARKGEKSEERFEFELSSAETNGIVVDEVGFSTTFLIDESTVHRVEVSDLEVTIFVTDGTVFSGEERVCDNDIAIGGGTEDIFTVIDSEVFTAMVAILGDDPADDGFLGADIEGIEIESDSFFAIFSGLRCTGSGWLGGSIADLTYGSSAVGAHIPVCLKRCLTVHTGDRDCLLMFIAFTLTHF